MSEYWKSTPTYWCKFCETYVRDTPISKQQHEATGKHQGAIQRSLRKLHKDQQNEERESQRAKDEVARLKGLVSGKESSGAAGNSVAKSRPTKAAASAATAAPKQASHQDRVQQMKQLAAMGIAVPDEYRKDVAQASEWQTVSTKPATDDGSLIDASVDSKSFGVRKRKLEDDEEKEEVIVPGQSDPQQRSWGSRMKTYQSKDEAEIDFDHLMSKSKSNDGHAIKKEESEHDAAPKFKKEEDKDDTTATSDATIQETKTDVLDEKPTPDAAPVVFKKRKAKAAKPS